MIRLLQFEWKAFLRSASYNTHLFIKIILALAALYLVILFFSLGFGLYFILEEQGMKPFDVVNRVLIYYICIDLVIRYFLQKMPVMNIRPFMIVNLKKNTVINFAITKTLFSFFNLVHIFFLIPFSIVLINKGFNLSGVFSWCICILVLIYINNYLNLLANNQDVFLYGLISVVCIGGLSEYFGLLDISRYTSPIFYNMYTGKGSLIVLFLIIVGLHYVVFRFYKKNFFLDGGLSIRTRSVHAGDYSWLNRFGTTGIFLKNDIKLLSRNKRSRSTLLISVLFTLYGLLFFSDGLEVYENPTLHIFAGIFVSGGFLFTFGQFVPSWDSAYYPLLMSQNIQYRDYLNSKWWLIVIATGISTVISSFYIFFGWDAYVAVLTGAIYNIGINAHLVLMGGAFIKTPIDLSKNKNIFGDKQAFNIKTLLLSLPKLVLPIVLFAIGQNIFNSTTGYLMVAGTGILGFTLKQRVFKQIEKIYQKEKYKTLKAYKAQNNF
ncbi:DUF5687 family protein [Membranihabitans maritimus]|uniref:DUF5687 family protein n=1 Tax=Membranihabitans maritimus TaxID=2904244 RepID=UPI001F286F18|nr:DUF5687 family protein [Membranihabitans maritimus]